MNFDTFSLAAIVSQLNQTILESRMQRVTQINSLNFGLELFVHPTRYYLMLSVEPQAPHLYLTLQKARRGSGNETPLMLVLRKYMRGARLRAIEQPPYERLLFLHFENFIGRTQLVVELLGPRSNIMLLDDEGIILGVARLPKIQKDKTNLPKRLYIPGQAYKPPPPQQKLNPKQLTEAILTQEFNEASPEFPIARLLPQIIAGVSPFVAREIVYRTTGHTKTTVAELEAVAPLLTECQTVFSYLWEERWQPTLIVDNAGIPINVTPYPTNHKPHTEPVEDFSAGIERYLAESAMAYAAAKEPLQEAIVEARRKLTRRQAGLQKDAQARANPDSFKQKGEALLAYAYQIEPGQTNLTVPWQPDQPPLEISLEPTLSAADNAQRYFQRYRKAQRSQEQIPAQFKKIALENQYLDQLEQDLEIADNREEIDVIAGTLMEAGYYQPTRQIKRRKKLASRYLRLTAPDGATVLVGKNAHQNAHLTFHRADGDDLWFHAHQLPGAHVVIPTAEGLPSEEDVLWAASVAAYYSRARHDTSVEVIVTLKKYVRAIKGAAPGLVTYRNESTLRVAPAMPALD